MNLIIIGSPSQYLYSLECLDQLGIKTQNSILLILYSQYSNVDQKSFDTIIKHSWKKIYYFELWHIHKNFIESFRRLFDFSRFIQKELVPNVYSNIISSHYYNVSVNHILNELKYNNYYCIDDGSAVFVDAKKRYNRAGFSIKKRIFFKIFYFL